ncbi:hypothetical protein VT03_06210 [Planctomyces sp. SH-PL14]|nr:hypothetical protein VT03_06210 [Planctomyces sp. SH-PL14]
MNERMKETARPPARKTKGPEDRQGGWRAAKRGLSECRTAGLRPAAFPPRVRRLTATQRESGLRRTAGWSAGGSDAANRFDDNRVPGGERLRSDLSHDADLRRGRRRSRQGEQTAERAVVVAVECWPAGLLLRGLSLARTGRVVMVVMRTAGVPVSRNRAVFVAAESAVSMQPRVPEETHPPVNQQNDNGTDPLHRRFQIGG